MKLFEISNRGLLVIGLLVAVLWGVIFAERALLLRAERDYREVKRSYPSHTVGDEPARTPLPLQRSDTSHPLAFG